MALENCGEVASWFRKAAPNTPQGQAVFYEDLAKNAKKKKKQGMDND